MVKVDVIVIGGGLAGCAMVWQCRLRGLRALLIDAPRADASSRVAAGLVTPITGSRFATSWHWNEFFPIANAYYRRIERETDQNFWNVAPAWRAFESEQEAECCFHRWPNAQPFHGKMVLPPPPDELQGGLSDELLVQSIPSNRLPFDSCQWGGLQMEPAARLDTRVYLEATRKLQEQDGLLVACNLDVNHDLEISDSGCRIPSLDLQARWVALCQGFWARTNRWFSTLPLHPARGDILEIASRNVRLDHVLHQGGWIVPLEQNRFLVGATYDRHALDTSPDLPAASQWRQELCNQWSRITGEPVGGVGATLLEHRIAVRPASYDRHPLIGPHMECPNLLCLNGLGSKGSLMAPYLSARLVDWMLEKIPVEKGMHWNRRAR